MPRSKIAPLAIFRTGILTSSLRNGAPLRRYQGKFRAPDPPPIINTRKIISEFAANSRQIGCVANVRFWTWLLVRLGAAILLVGWAYFALLTPPAGDQEFRRTREALKTIKSVHLTMVSDNPSQHIETETDLNCAEDSFRHVSHIVVHQPDKDSTLDQSMLRSGGQDYVVQNDGTWKRGYSGIDRPSFTCQYLAQGARSWIAPDMEEMLTHGIIEKGDKKTVNGAVCREWNVTMRIGVISEHRTVCIGIKDHLPREMQDSLGNAKFTYAYNVPVKIDAPDNITPEPTHDNYQPPPPGLSLSNDDETKQ